MSYPTLSSSGYSGAGNNRLNGDWRLFERDPNIDWVQDAPVLRARAWDLYNNDPVVTALVTSKIIGTHGSRGLRFRSLYGDGDTNTTTDQESDKRREIEDAVNRASDGCQLDADGLLTRHEMDEALDLLATVAGEGFAIRLFVPGRQRCELATCWRIIRPERVRNPPGEVDGAKLYQGIVIGEFGGPEGIWIQPPRRNGAYSYEKRDWVFVPWYGEDGSRNVIHRKGLSVPGCFRSVSMLAPLLAQAQQVKGVMDAYVVAKRIQACHPLFIRCDDPIEAAKKDQNGAVYGPNTRLEPGKVYYIGRDSELSAPNWSFQGADLKEFLDTNYRNMFAALGMPIDVVLAQLGETNMAASRSAWQQYYRRCEIWQDDHIEQVSGPMNESIVRESIARGELTGVSGSWSKIMAGRYVRPPRAMPDPLKEAQAIKEWAGLGRDLTGLWAEAGIDFRESILQRAEDNKLLEAQGVFTGIEYVAERIVTEPKAVENIDGTPVEKEETDAPDSSKPE